MPIISRIRKKSPALKIQVVVIYLLLIFGSAAMVYPFLIMLSGSVKSSVDSTRFDVFPRYLVDDAELFRKYQESRYCEDVLLYNSVTGEGIMSFEEVVPPKHVNHLLVEDWRTFISKGTMQPGFFQLAEISSVGSKLMPRMQRQYAEHCFSCYKGDLAKCNIDFGLTATAWFYIVPPREMFIEKSYVPDATPGYRFFQKFKLAQPAISRIYLSVENQYRYSYLALKYGSSIEEYNKQHSTSFKSYSDILLPVQVPAGGKERLDWQEFVRENLNRVFIQPNPQAIGDYRMMLRKKYDDSIEKLNHAYDWKYTSFEEVEFPQKRDEASAQVVDYNLFVMSGKLETFRLTGPDTLFKDYLKSKYRSISRFNKVAGTNFTSFAAVSPPLSQYDWRMMHDNRKAVVWEFLSRNYKMVFSYILIHGRGILNTVWFCLLSVVIALTINPVAAYALSRYKLPSTYKVLFFMMSTMAFPAAVTMIPNFLLLKELHLLNTVWALVLPGVANGYSIFLLKGFFDSLPRELYEASMMDGASEWTMFWRITMSLSKPILAVMALGAFTAAYGAFMYAFTVCQDQDMWTLMVWLFKLQRDAHTVVTYAALTVAAIPTLVVFILSQNVIMRGIIVPQEK